MYIYKVFFISVKPESGPLNYSKLEYLHIPGKELNVNKITEQIFHVGSEEVLLNLLGVVDSYQCS